MDDIITFEECITRLDAIRHEIVPDSRDHFALSAGIAALYEMENGHATNQWIPCSERLPEQGERVIVAIFGSDMIIPNEGETLQDAIERSRKEGYITVGFIGSDGWYGADWFPLMVQPSYWMPKPDLPEPPEKE